MSFLDQLLVDLNKTPCINPMLRPQQMTATEEVRQITPWDVWLKKNLNTLNENAALQVHTKFQCENPAC